MPPFTLIQLLLCCFFFAIGFVAASWLCWPQVPAKSQRRAETTEPETEDLEVTLTSPPPRLSKGAGVEDDALRQAELREVMNKVQALTSDMRTDVSKHTDTVASINDDLQAISVATDPEAVARVIGRLVEANHLLDTRLNEAESRLQQQSELLQSHRAAARTDALTRLANRRAFDEELDRLHTDFTRRGHAASLLMIDIDHFKAFNDTHGHQAGDLCLQEVAQVIAETVAPPGGIAARYGGEEFAVLLPKASLIDAQTLALRLNVAIEEKEIRFNDQIFQITASLGVAQVRPEETEAQWLGRADQALYAAKREGRNRAYWHDGQKCREVVCESSGELALDGTQFETRTTAPLADVSNGPGTDRWGERREAFVRDLHRRLALFRRKGEPMAVILVTIDSRGKLPIEAHPKFAAMQQAVAKIFGAAIREMDHFSQLADNRFGVLLPTATAEDAATVAERTRKAVEKFSSQTETGEARFSISCGVSEALEGDSVEQMLKRAERCLTQARKERGDAVYLLRDDDAAELPLRVTAARVATS